MASFTSAISDFVKSIFELFASFFQTLFQLIETIFRTIFNFFASVLQLGADSFKGVFDVLGGVANFLLGESSCYLFGRTATNIVLANVVLIGLIAAGGYGYLVYQRKQGNTVTVQGKKLN
jgi:hypothetical protein